MQGPRGKKSTGRPPKHPTTKSREQKAVSVKGNKFLRRIEAEHKRLLDRKARQYPPYSDDKAPTAKPKEKPVTGTKKSRAAAVKAEKQVYPPRRRMKR